MFLPLNLGRILKKGAFFLSPERAATYQPRATPWVKSRYVFSPERASHNMSMEIGMEIGGMDDEIGMMRLGSHLDYYI